jgi:hypothetical protein
VCWSSATAKASLVAELVKGPIAAPSDDAKQASGRRSRTQGGSWFHRCGFIRGGIIDSEAEDGSICAGGSIRGAALTPRPSLSRWISRERPGPKATRSISLKDQPEAPGFVAWAAKPGRHTGRRSTGIEVLMGPMWLKGKRHRKSHGGDSNAVRQIQLATDALLRMSVEQLHNERANGDRDSQSG